MMQVFRNSRAENSISNESIFRKNTMTGETRSRHGSVLRSWKLLYVCALVSAGLVLTGTSSLVSAQEVNYVGIPKTVSVTEDGVAKQVELSSFTLLGLVRADRVSILRDGIIYEVALADLQAAFPGITTDILTDGTTMTSVGAGSSGDTVANIQQMLVNQGYLIGTPNGSYSDVTVTAVSNFQRDHGLPATGFGGVNTQLLLKQGEDGTLDQVINLGEDGLVRSVSGGKKSAEEEAKEEEPLTVERKFADIYQETEADLNAFLGENWTYSYDVLTGKGILSNGLNIGKVSVTEPSIDALEMNAFFAIRLERNLMGDGLISLLPAIQIESTGASRPYVQDIVFVSDKDIFTLGGAVIEGKVEGIVLKESSYVPMTEEAIAFLQEHEDVKIRIEGRNSSYDMNLTTDPVTRNAFLTAISGL